MLNTPCSVCGDDILPRGSDEDWCAGCAVNFAGAQPPLILPAPVRIGARQRTALAALAEAWEREGQLVTPLPWLDTAERTHAQD